MMDSDVLVDRYVSAYSDFGVDRNNAKCLFDMFPDNIRVVGNSFCVFVNVSDKTIRLMRNGFYDMRSLENVMNLFRERGENIHVLAVVGCGFGALRSLARSFNGKSLSWFERDLSRFVYFDRR